MRKRARKTEQDQSAIEQTQAAPSLSADVWKCFALDLYMGSDDLSVFRRATDVCKERESGNVAHAPTRLIDAKLRRSFATGDLPPIKHR